MCFFYSKVFHRGLFPSPNTPLAALLPVFSLDWQQVKSASDHQNQHCWLSKVSCDGQSDLSRAHCDWMSTESSQC